MFIQSFYPQIRQNIPSFKGSEGVINNDSMQDGNAGGVHNVYRYLKKSLYSVDELIENVAILDDEKRCIGSLPVEWTEGFAPDEIGENTKKVYSIFAKFAKDVSKIPVHSSIYRDGDEKYKKLVGRFGHILEPRDEWLDKFEALENELGEVFLEKPEISYLAGGSYGVVFKVKLNGKTCALKTYFYDGYSKESDLIGHGAACEIANAVYLNSTLKPSQCSRFYCAKNPALGELDGFLTTEFEDGFRNNTQASKNRMDWFMREGPYWGRICFGDCHDDNFSNGKLIDFGDVSYTFKTRKTLKLAKELMPAIVSGNVEKVKALKEKYTGTSELLECMEHLWIYAGEIKTNDVEAFAEHCIEYNVTRKMIDGFRALGADYSQIESADFSAVEDDECRDKLEELFN